MRTKNFFIVVVVALILLLCATITNAGILNDVMEKRLIRRNDNNLDSAELCYIEQKLNESISKIFKNIPIELHMKLLYYFEATLVFFLTIGNDHTPLGNMIKFSNKIKNLFEFLKTIPKEKITISNINKNDIEMLSMNTTLHEICSMLFEIVSLIFGHNVISYLIVILFTIWFVLPVVCVDCIGGGNTGTFWEKFNFYWGDDIVEEYIYRFGIFGIVGVGIWFIVIAIVSLLETLGEIGGLGGRIAIELNEIYDFGG